MPGIPATYNPNDKAINAAGDTERTARLKYLDDRWKYYDGDQFLWLKKDPGATRDDNITLNLCGRSVDKTVEFIGKPEDFSVAGTENVDERVESRGLNSEVVAMPAQQALDALYEQYECEVTEIIQDNLIAGHSFLKLHLDADGQPAMTLLDARYVTVFWDQMNYKRVLFYRLQWAHGDISYRQDIIPDWLLMPPAEDDLTMPVAENWIIIDFKQDRGSSDWKTIRQEVWAHPFAPIVDWPHKRRPHQYYGVSFLHNSIQLNDAVNFVASNAARMIKHDAHRKAFAFGFQVSDENAVGGVWDDLPTDGRIEFSPTDNTIASSLDFLMLLKGEFFANQRVLDQSNVKDKVGALTNFGVRMLFSDMLEMSDEIREAVGGGLAKAFQYLLAVGGTVLDKPPTAEWPEPLPVNRLEQLQAAKIESELGTTSQTTLAESIDRDPALEQQLKANEQSNATNTLTDVLSSIGNRGLFGGNGIPVNRPPMNGSQRLPMAG